MGAVVDTWGGAVAEGVKVPSAAMMTKDEERVYCTKGRQRKEKRRREREKGKGTFTTRVSALGARRE